MSELTRIRRALRVYFCLDCHRRPEGSDMLGPEATRFCETGCQRLNCLPRLASLAYQSGGEPPGGYRAAIQRLTASMPK